MSLYAYTGKPRHGKTYHLAKTGAQFLKKGTRVFSNIFLNLGEGALKQFKAPIWDEEKKEWDYNDTIIGNLHDPKDKENEKKILFYWRNIHEWEHMDNGKILCDEGTRYFNSRAWDQLSEETIIKLQQHGKEDLDVYLTVQHHSRIDVILRQLVEKYIHMKTIWGNPNNKKPFMGLKIIRATYIDEEDLDDWDRVKKMPELAEKMVLDVRSKLLLFRKKYAKIYDTRQMVGRSESVPLVHKTRQCLTCGKEQISHH